MRKTAMPLACIMLPLALSGCNKIGDKAGNISGVYLIAAILSVVVFAGYFFFVRKKDPWYLLLFGSVMVVNIGYYMLAVSGSLAFALHANRLAYFGSVFLPFSMWMIILKMTNTQYRKWLPYLLLAISVIVFLIAASPGYLDIYYKEISFEKVNGVSVLEKEYGPLHILYLIYLLGYFAVMVATIIHAAAARRMESPVYAGILLVAVGVNIGVWLIEQLIKIEFEVLSVSYIISECFLLGLHLLVAENKKTAMENLSQKPQPEQTAFPQPTADAQAHMQIFAEGLTRLTPKEKEIYAFYIQGMTTAQIREKLQIKENTLKFHNKNLYGKLGVSSRKQLLYYAALTAEAEQ